MTITREDARFWDVRTIERRIRKGLVAKKDVDKHLKGLPDAAGKIAPAEDTEQGEAYDGSSDD